jgi:hypothetical protein
MGDEVRGSEKWLEESFQSANVRLEEEDLRALIDIAAIEGVKLVDWHTHGIPAPDVLRGIYQVEPGVAEEVFKRLTAMNHWYWHDWFPIGIPNVERFLVNFSNERTLGQ